MQTHYKHVILHFCMPKPYIFGLHGLSWLHLFHKHVEFAKYLLPKICKHTINMLCYIFVCQNHIFLDCLVFPDCISFIIMFNSGNILCKNLQTNTFLLRNPWNMHVNGIYHQLFYIWICINPTSCRFLMFCIHIVCIYFCNIVLWLI